MHFTLPLLLALVTSSTAPRLVTSSTAPRLVPEERMEFAIDFKGVRLGKASIFLGRADGSVVPAFLQTRTTGIASIISLRQQFSSHLDRQTGLPRSHSLDSVEGDYRHSDTVVFDREGNKATIRERGKYDNTYVIDVPPDTLDFIAMVYLLRQVPLEPGMRHPFHVLSGRTVSLVEAQFEGRERVSTSLGEIAAVKVRVPTNFSGEFQEKNPTIVWFSDDPRRIVVRISSDFAIGRATATLVSYSPGVVDPTREPDTAQQPRQRDAPPGGASLNPSAASSSRAFAWTIPALRGPMRSRCFSVSPSACSFGSANR